MPPLYLFDIDGTLIGGDGSGRRAFERALEELFNFPNSLVDIRLDGMTDPLILNHAFDAMRGRPPTRDESEAVFATYLRHLEYEIAVSAYHIKPAVTEVLDLLESRRAMVGLATGNLADGARLKLTRGQLWNRFPFGGFGSDATDRAQLVRVAIERAETLSGRSWPREEIFVIGDTPRDVTAAHAAGACAIGVATGSHTIAELEAAGAEGVYPTLREWHAAIV